MAGKESLLVGEVLMDHAMEFRVYPVCQRYLKLCMHFNHLKSLFHIQGPSLRCHGCWIEVVSVHSI